nr:hypothetical protein [uncultured Rhodopila sp.]
MNEELGREIAERITRTPEALDQFRKDPVGVFASNGLALTPDDRQMLLAVKGLHGAELMPRMSMNNH